MKLFQILQVKYLEFSNEHWKYPFNFFRILIKYQWLHLSILLVSILKTLWNFSSIVPISSAKTPIHSQRETRLSKQIKNDSDRLLCWSRAEHLHKIWRFLCILSSLSSQECWIFQLFSLLLPLNSTLYCSAVRPPRPHQPHTIHTQSPSEVQQHEMFRLEYQTGIN